MSDFFDLFLLLGLAGSIGLWLKFSRARELAVLEARRQCDQYGLQLLDETVGLRGLRLRRDHGAPMLERCYAFEVSVHGDDREPGRIWMLGDRLSGVRLPRPPAASTLADAPAATNVIPLRRRDHPTLH